MQDDESEEAGKGEQAQMLPRLVHRKGNCAKAPVVLLLIILGSFISLCITAWSLRKEILASFIIYSINRHISEKRGLAAQQVKRKLDSQKQQRLRLRYRRFLQQTQSSSQKLSPRKMAPTNISGATTPIITGIATPSTDAGSQKGKEVENPGELHRMPPPGSPLAKTFIGKDITAFLLWYNMITDSAKLPGPVKVTYFPAYCGSEVVAAEVETFSGYINQDWASLEEELKHEYRSGDSYHTRKGVAFLEKLASASYTSDQEIKSFIRVFAASATTCLASGKVTTFMINQLLLQGCGKTLAKKMTRKFQITNEDKLASINFSDLVREATSRVEPDEVITNLFGSRQPQKEEEGSTLRSQKTVGFVRTQEPASHSSPRNVSASSWTANDQSFPKRREQEETRPPPLNTERTWPKDIHGDTIMGDGPQASNDARIADLSDQLSAMRIMMLKVLPRDQHTGQNNQGTQRPPFAGFASNTYNREVRPPRQDQPTEETGFGSCWACREVHRGVWRDCDFIRDLEKRGLIHFDDNRQRVYGGPVGSNAPPARWQGTERVREMVLDAARPFSTASNPVLWQETPARASAVSVTCRPMGHESTQTAYVTHTMAQDSYRIPPRIAQRGEPIPTEDHAVLSEKAPIKRLQYELAGTKDDAAKKMIQNILDAQIVTDVKTVLASDEGMRKAFFNRLPLMVDPKLSAEARQVIVDDTRPAADPQILSRVSAIRGHVIGRRVDGTLITSDDFIKPCAYADITIGGHREFSLLDDGSESNLMSKEVALELGIPVGHHHGFAVAGIAGDAKCEGTAIDVPISFGVSTAKTHFLIVKDMACGILLGRPWSMAAGFARKEGNGFWSCTVQDEDTGHTTEFRAGFMTGEQVDARRRLMSNTKNV
jgi:hypothetical protein